MVVGVATVFSCVFKIDAGHTSGKFKGSVFRIITPTHSSPHTIMPPQKTDMSHLK